MALYRDYDQAGLDAQYNLRARVPGFILHFQRWAETSAAVRRMAPAKLDLRYGKTPAEALDFFPAAVRGAPLLVFIHGGYWQSLDKSDFSFIAPAYQQAGVSVAVVNYALAPTVTMAEIVRQNRAAIAWLGAEAGRLGIDAARLFVAGHSAGGHLTAMMLATSWSEWGLRAEAVRGGAAVSGVYDLEPIRLCYLNAVLGMDAAAAERLSPVRLAPRAGSRLILALGSLETEEFHRQQKALAAAWRPQGCAIDEMVLAEDDHFTAIDRLADPTSPLCRALLRQIFGA